MHTQIFCWSFIYFLLYVIFSLSQRRALLLHTGLYAARVLIYILFCVIQVHALLYVFKMSFCESILPQSAWDVTARRALLLHAGLYAARVLIYILFCVIQNKRGHEDPNSCSLSMIDTQRRKHRYKWCRDRNFTLHGTDATPEWRRDWGDRPTSALLQLDWVDERFAILENELWTEIFLIHENLWYI